MNIFFEQSNSQEIVGATNQSIAVSYDLIGTPKGIPKVAHGVITQNPNGTYSYTPNTGFFGIDTLRFDDGQSMSLLVGPPAGKGLKDVAQGVQTIGTTISNVMIDGQNDPNSNLTNNELDTVDNREFSHFTLENNAKWEQLGQKADIDGDGKEWEFEYFDSKLQELEDIATQTKELDSKLNLHTVLWNQPGYQPEHIAARYNEEIVIGNNGVVTNEFRTWFEEQIGAHVDTLLNTLGNSVNIIDVINEHVFSDVQDNSGLYHKFYDKPTDYIKVAFAQTSATITRYNASHAPEEQIDARLAINDFNVLYRFDENKYDPASNTEEVKADIYYNTVKDLIDDGVEIDVVSFQSHLVVDRINDHIGKNTDNDDLHDNVTPTGQEIYDAILSNLQRFIDLGVEIVISELDVRTHLNVVDDSGDKNQKNSEFNKIYEVIGALAHDIPEITDVVLWGTTHNTSWLKGFENDPLLFKNNYGREDEYYAFMEGLTGNSQYNRAEAVVTNHNPHAENDGGYTIAAGGSAAIDVLSNDSDRDGDTLAVTHINGTPFNAFGWSNYIDGVGLIHLNADGSLTQYALDTPPGTTSFHYTVDDGKGGAHTATVTGSIGQAQNIDPIAVNDGEYTVASGNSAILNVLGNDSDPDGDALVVTHINGVELSQFGWTNYIPEIGILKRNSDGNLTQYALDAPVGPFTFSYTVSDKNGGTTTADVIGSIAQGQNNNPIANDVDGYTIIPGQPAKIDVLGNDTDADGDLLAVTHINGALLSDTGWTDYISGVGTIQRNADGTLTQYALDAPAGLSSFEYTISDGMGGTASASATGTIAPPATLMPAAEPATTENNTAPTTTNTVAPPATQSPAPEPATTENDAAPITTNTVAPSATQSPAPEPATTESQAAPTTASTVAPPSTQTISSDFIITKNGVAAVASSSSAPHVAQTSSSDFIMNENSGAAIVASSIAPPSAQSSSSDFIMTENGGAAIVASSATPSAAHASSSDFILIEGEFAALIDREAIYDIETSVFEVEELFA